MAIPAAPDRPTLRCVKDATGALLFQVLPQLQRLLEAMLWGEEKEG